MSARAVSRWVVVKFGGTSVSSLATWRNIALVVKRRQASGNHVLVVHSAITGITDQLEKLLAAGLAGKPEEPLKAIEVRHRQLTTELGLEVSPQLQSYFDELRQMANGIALVRELSDRTRARVMANGELMATEIGARFLKSQGIDVTWMDARDMLSAEDRGASARASVLSATCSFAPDASLEQRLDAATPVVITQGFIARDSDGNTCLLGRGGSDTSASYLGAKIRARAIEIWTDVPGMFSANPRATPNARLIRALHYDEAQEIATSGAKVLHPRCLLPARQYQIPLYVYATQTPDLEGTLITGESAPGAHVKAICNRKGITLISLDSPGMWHQVGFMADAFAVFKEHGMSVDLVSTSETNVTVTLDPSANTLDGELLGRLQRDLSKLSNVRVIGPCASVSLVGRNIRAILHKLGDAFALFEEQKVYLLSQAANDLNFTFVVDENQGDRLVEQLHELLIRPAKGDPVMGPTWEQLFARPEVVAARAQPWWATKRAMLLEALATRDSAYVYDLGEIDAAAKSITGLKSVSRALYALKANPHPDILRTVAAQGVGFDCVSLAEIEHVLESVPGLPAERILFTPNFAPRTEYLRALAFGGVNVTIDNLFVLQHWLDAFKGKSVFLRIDTGIGRGHHHHVKTAGAQSKFGIPVEELDEVVRLAEAGGVVINGLHAHAGSGVFDVENWTQVGSVLAGLVKRFPDVKYIDVGGGLGVPDRVEGRELDLARLDEALAKVKAALPGIELWLEPGRFFVANAGVLLARVTQTKVKSGIRYVGVATGMNSLIRPALYGAHHDIVNLTRYGEPANISANVVGPICESSDFLGHDRLLPECRSGDVMLIATAGAYGRAMSSNYNLRAPAEELLI
jgi:bifunctional diaminopimelate decarboxylase / aspartate kinase